GPDRALDVGPGRVDDLDVQDRHESAERGADDGDPGPGGGGGSGRRGLDAGGDGRGVVECCLRRGHFHFLSASPKNMYCDAGFDNRGNAGSIIHQDLKMPWPASFLAARRLTAPCRSRCASRSAMTVALASTVVSRYQ